MTNPADEYIVELIEMLSKQVRNCTLSSDRDKKQNLIDQIVQHVHH